MDTEYDFVQTINSTQLLDEINTAGLPAPDYITTADTAVQIFYTSDLTPDQQTTLTNVVTNHVADPSYIPLSVQADINTLIAYLNNANTTIANAARAVMIVNIAPRMPDGMIASINAQIHSKTGV